MSLSLNVLRIKRERKNCISNDYRCLVTVNVRIVRLKGFRARGSCVLFISIDGSPRMNVGGF